MRGSLTAPRAYLHGIVFASCPALQHTVSLLVMRELGNKSNLLRNVWGDALFFSSWQIAILLQLDQHLVCSSDQIILLQTACIYELQSVVKTDESPHCTPFTWGIPFSSGSSDADAENHMTNVSNLFQSSFPFLLKLHTLCNRISIPFCIVCIFSHAMPLHSSGSSHQIRLRRIDLISVGLPGCNFSLLSALYTLQLTPISKNSTTNNCQFIVLPSAQRNWENPTGEWYHYTLDFRSQ